MPRRTLILVTPPVARVDGTAVPVATVTESATDSFEQWRVGAVGSLPRALARGSGR